MRKKEKKTPEVYNFMHAMVETEDGERVQKYVPMSEAAFMHAVGRKLPQKIVKLSPEPGKMYLRDAVVDLA